MDDRPRVALYSHVNAGHARKMSCFTSEVDILILVVKFFQGLNQANISSMILSVKYNFNLCISSTIEIELSLFTGKELFQLDQ